MQECNRDIMLRGTLEGFQMEEETRIWRVFLSACNNFNSDFENLELLFYGFIHFTIDDINIYENTPMDIIDIIIVLTYDVAIANKKGTHSIDFFVWFTKVNYLSA